MKKLRITVGKKTYDVTVEVLSDDAPTSPSVGAQAAPVAPSTSPAPAPAASAAPASTPQSHGAGDVDCPMAGTVKSILVKQGEEVSIGKALVVLEAMKMENQITATIAGTVKSVNVEEGASVQEGEVLLVIE